MKKIVQGILIIFFFIGLFHVFLWPVNKKMYEGFRKLGETSRPVKNNDLKALREDLEMKEREKLKTWKKLENGHAEIPLDRAMDYYLAHQRR